MRLKAMIAGAFATLVALPAAAEMPLYPYHGPNHCPAGLQPVVMGGVICCGSPNQTHTYAQMMAHPVKKRAHTPVQRGPADDCPIGQKGCN